MKRKSALRDHAISLYRTRRLEIWHAMFENCETNEGKKKKRHQEAAVLTACWCARVTADPTSHIATSSYSATAAGPGHVHSRALVLNATTPAQALTASRWGSGALYAATAKPCTAATPLHRIWTHACYAMVASATMAYWQNAGKHVLQFSGALEMWFDC